MYIEGERERETNLNHLHQTVITKEAAIIFLIRGVSDDFLFLA